MSEEHCLFAVVFRIPDNHRSILASRSNALSVGRECDGPHRCRLFIKVGRQRALYHIPYQNRAISMSRNQPPSIRRKGKAPDDGRVLESGEFALCGRVPKHDVISSSRNQPAIWRIGHSAPIILMGLLNREDPWLSLGPVFTHVHENNVSACAYGDLAGTVRRERGPI